MSKAREMHRVWSRDPAYSRAYDDLDSKSTCSLADLNPVSAGRVLKPLRIDDDLLGEMLDDDRD